MDLAHADLGVEDTCSSRLCAVCHLAAPQEYGTLDPASFILYFSILADVASHAVFFWLRLDGIPFWLRLDGIPVVVQSVDSHRRLPMRFGVAADQPDSGRPALGAGPHDMLSRPVLCCLPRWVLRVVDWPLLRDLGFS